MENKVEIMYRTESEKGIEYSIQQRYYGGWELISMCFTGSLAEDGYKEVALVYKYVR